MTKDEIKAFMELKQADMPFEVKDVTETLGCEKLTIVTHDEETTIESQRHGIRVIPTWKWLISGFDGQ